MQLKMVTNNHLYKLNLIVTASQIFIKTTFFQLNNSEFYVFIIVFLIIELGKCVFE